MKRCCAVYFLIGPLLAVCSYLALASGDPDPIHSRARVPDTAAARRSSELIARAERAINAYVAACATGQERALSQVTTSDLRIEYALDEPGTFLSTDPASFAENCAAIGGPMARVQNLWILPTDDAVSVFVQYEAEAPAGAPAQRQLALMEMRGERIKRLVQFAGAPRPQAVVADASSSGIPPCGDHHRRTDDPHPHGSPAAVE